MNFIWGLGHACPLPALAVLPWAQGVMMFSVSLRSPQLCPSASVHVDHCWIHHLKTVSCSLLLSDAKHVFLPNNYGGPVPNCPPHFSYICTLSSLLQQFGTFTVQWIRYPLSYLLAAVDFLTAPAMPSPPAHTSWQVLPGLQRTLDTIFLKASPNPLVGSHPPAPPQTQASFHPVPPDICILQ